MSGDLFPIYCRQCHKEITPAARVCPYCSAPQGLTQQPPAAAAEPPQPQQQQQMQYTAGTSAAPPSPVQGASTCYHCLTQVTPGDIFCRACGKTLVPGMRGGSVDGAEAAARAYGISAIVCALLGFGVGAVILGLVAMVKGSRTLGCLAIAIGVVTSGLMLFFGAGLLQQVRHMLPSGAGLGIPKDLLP